MIKVAHDVQIEFIIPIITCVHEICTYTLYTYYSVLLICGDRKIECKYDSSMN